MGRSGRQQAGTLLLMAGTVLLLLQCAAGAGPVRSLEYRDVARWQRMERLAMEAMEATGEDLVNVTCTMEEGNNRTVTCNNQEYNTEEEDRGLRMWFDILICIILILFAGTMSGLTMGLLSMDIVNLEIILKSGSPTQRKYVKRILPLVKRHHLLLVTLLIGNALAMEALPIFLDRIVHPALAILLSVTAVLFFGEIIPQALCTRYGLAIGANLFWLVWTLIAVLFVIAWPISKLLDLLLGHDSGTYYRRAELKELVDIHEIGKREHTMEDGLTEDEVTVIKGALDMKNKTVRDAMTPADKVSMLSFDDVLDRKKLEKIVAEGHSRWPVYRGNKDNIVGMVLIKSLVLHNPDEPLKVSDLQMHRLPSVPDNVQLYHMLDMFQQGKSHLAVVVKASDCMSVVGVLSLEDIVEELIGEEILDETDVFLDVARQVRVVRAFKESLVDTERVEAQLGASDSIQLHDSSDDDDDRPHAVLENYRGYASSGDENEPLLP